MQNFEIVGKLGSGAYSSVFKAKRKSDGQMYALKKVNNHFGVISHFQNHN